MASISKRFRKNGSIAWQVQIRIEGRPSISKTFDNEEEAKIYCSIAEEKAAALNGKAARSIENIFKQMKFGDVIALFLASPENKGQYKTAINSVRRFVGDVTIGELTPGFIARYVKTMGRTKNKRGTIYTGSTIIQHLTAMSGIYKWYAADYEIVPPAGLFSKKNVPRGWNVRRDRRLSDSEYQLITEALKNGRTKNAEHMKLLIDLALETGARLREMLSAQWHEFDLKNFLWRIPKEHTKAKTERNVPLTNAACQAIERLKILRSNTSPRLFHSINSNVISTRFFVLFKRLNIKDLRFHDLRHEAISRMVLYCRDLSVYEIMKIVGHKSIEMLHRYANIRPEEMIDRFRRRTTPDHL